MMRVVSLLHIKYQHILCYQHYSAAAELAATFSLDAGNDAATAGVQVLAGVNIIANDVLNAI